MDREIPHRRADDADNVVLKVIEHVDLKLMAHQRQTTEWLSAHEKHERERYGVIREEIAEGRRASQERHDALLESLNVYMAKIDAAFHATPCPHLAASIPEQDWSGHSTYHIEVMNWDSKIKALKWFVVKGIVSAAVLATASWVGVLAWNGFLNGPKG